MSNRDEKPIFSLDWRALSYWLASALVALGGLAAGLWSSSLDKRLNDLDASHSKRFDDIMAGQSKQAAILQERAGLAPRLDSAERQTQDQEQRLRAVERQVWQGKR